VKLAKIAIENFRQLGTSLHPLKISFTDPMDRIRDFTVLVGPNSSGKTTILDAIGAAIGSSLEMPTTRRDFKRSPPSVVRRGAQYARVTCWLRFSPDEVPATREFLHLADINQAVPDTSEVKLTWEYPDPRLQSDSVTTTLSDR
jgi:DNA repair exonuclease SbcCD ATPase subunit